MLPYKADIREISHRIETPSIVCVSGGGSTNINILGLTSYGLLLELIV